MPTRQHSLAQQAQTTPLTTQQFYLSVDRYLRLFIYYLLPLIVIGFIMQWLYRKALLFSSARIEQRIDERTQALQRENERLQEMSLKDPLTGLKNRHFIKEVITQDLNRVKRAYDSARHTNQAPLKADMLTFIIDIDHFKSINDTYGHRVGDCVLAKVAERLNSLFRNYDYVVRWGGEEFLVVARFVDRQQIDRLAEKVRQAIEAMEFVIENHPPINITVSIGAAPYPFSANQYDKMSWEQVIHLADMALYAAKGASRNTWFSYVGNEKVPLSEEIIRPLEQGVIHHATSISSRQCQLN